MKFHFSLDSGGFYSEDSNIQNEVSYREASAVDACSIREWIDGNYQWEIGNVEEEHSDKKLDLSVSHQAYEPHALRVLHPRQQSSVDKMPKLLGHRQKIDQTPMESTSATVKKSYLTELRHGPTQTLPNPKE